MSPRITGSGSSGGNSMQALLIPILTALGVDGVTALLRSMGGGNASPTSSSTSQSKYMTTMGDELAVIEYVNSENFRRQNLARINAGLAPISAKDIINDRNARARVMAQEAGEREAQQNRIKGEYEAIRTGVGSLGDMGRSAAGIAQTAAGQVLQPDQRLAQAMAEVARGF